MYVIILMYIVRKRSKTVRENNVVSSHLLACVFGNSSIGNPVYVYCPSVRWVLFVRPTEIICANL